MLFSCFCFQLKALPLQKVYEVIKEIKPARKSINATERSRNILFILLTIIRLYLNYG